MNKRYHIGTSFIILIAVLALDQITKYIVATTMQLRDSYNVIPGFLNITSHRNPGAAWGILSGHMSLFFIITIVVIAVLISFYIKEAKHNLFMQISISLLMAGAIGNFIDRLRLGEVIDFIDTYIFGYDFPIFNVADASLTVGVIFILIALLRDNKRQSQEG